MPFYKTKAFRFAAIGTLLVALYAVAGFVIAPKLVRTALLENVQKALGVTPSVGEIRINPFLFQVELRDFALPGAGGEKLLGFERLFIDFELSSIWHRAYSFARIDLSAPYVNAAVAPDGALNLAQLRPKTPPPAAAKTTTEPLPAVRVGSFSVTKGSLSYDDRSRPSEFTARLEPINFELKDFTTGVEGGRFTFTGASKEGERVEWHGHLSVQPLASDGEFRIDGLRADTIWDYIKDRVSFAVDSGTIDLNATYRFSLKDTAGAASPVDLRLDVAKVALTDLTVRPKDSSLAWITVPGLTLSGTTMDLQKRRAHADSLALTGVKLVAWLEPDGALNLSKLAQIAPAPTPVAALTTVPSRAPPAGRANDQAPTPAGPAATNAPAFPGPATSGSAPQPVAPAAGPAWQFDLHDFDLRDAAVSAEDRTTRPAAKVELAPLSLHVGGASLDLAQPVNVTLDTHVNGAGSLTVNGALTAQPLAADVTLKWGEIELAALQPYIAQHTAMTLLSGRLGGAAKLGYGLHKPKPALLFSGNVSVTNLHTVDNDLHDDFINWERLDIFGLKYQQGPDRLDIAQIVAHAPYARVIIESDSSLNVKHVLAGPGAPVAAAANPPAAAKTDAAHALPAPMAAPAAVASGPPAAAPTFIAARAPATASRPARAPAAAANAMPMSIKKIVLQNGRADFADRSVAPNFSTGIQSLAGTVSGLSSNPKSRARVELHGNVDEFSPVAITGDVNVLSAALYTDLSMSFRNMELSTFNPYSGKFAGYNITKGKLTTELHYKVEGRKLDAQHHIVIEQLEFGDKTASKDAVSLPVKLAVALLKDRDGVINLDLPVTGSLDDPQFKLGPIIWKIFIHLLEKAVTAPFALLGSLFGGGPELQFIDFKPGLAILDPGAADKIKAVAKALIERPQLKIDVPIGFVSDLDRPALIGAQFNARLGAAQGAAALELLTRMYREDLGAAPEFPDSVTGLKSKPEILAAKIDFLSRAVRDRIVVDASQLQALGQQRAMALQQALLTGTQIDPGRVFLVANDKAAAQDGQVRLELSLR